jgi:hypothetical protein
LIYIYIYIYITHIYIYIYIFICKYIYDTHILKVIYIHTYTHKYLYAHIRKSVCVHLYLHVWNKLMTSRLHTKIDKKEENTHIEVQLYIHRLEKRAPAQRLGQSMSLLLRLHPTFASSLEFFMRVYMSLYVLCD